MSSMAPPAAGSTPKLSRSTPGGLTSAANAKSSALRFRQRISEPQANAGSSPAKNSGLSSPKKRLDFDQLDSGSPVSSKGKKTRMEATHDLDVLESASVRARSEDLGISIENISLKDSRKE